MNGRTYDKQGDLLWGASPTPKRNPTVPHPNANPNPPPRLPFPLTNEQIETVRVLAYKQLGPRFPGLRCDRVEAFVVTGVRDQKVDRLVLQVCNPPIGDAYMTRGQVQEAMDLPGLPGVAAFLVEVLLHSHVEPGRG